MIYILFGYSWTFLNVFVDLKWAYDHLYFDDLVKTQHKSSDMPVQEENLLLLLGYFKNKPERIMPYKDVAGDIRDNLSIMDSIVKTLRPKGLIHFMQDSSVSKSMAKSVSNFEEKRDESRALTVKLLDNRQWEVMMDRIKEFSTLKQVLERNSFFVFLSENNRVKSVDCHLLSILLQDLIRFKTCLKVEDDDFIFIKRARDPRKEALKKRSEMAIGASAADEAAMASELN